MKIAPRSVPWPTRGPKTVKAKSFLKTISTAYDQWLGLLKDVPPDQMIKPGKKGNWSIKDTLAHIAWYEKEMIPLIHQHKLAGSPLWNMPTDQRNQIIFEQNRDRSLEDILDESKKIHTDFMQAVKTLSDTDLVDPSHFKDMPKDWTPWKIIAGNSFEHYLQHLADFTSSIRK
jgi:uncharacterized damage-inducible protein DinB